MFVILFFVLFIGHAVLEVSFHFSTVADDIYLDLQKIYFFRPLFL